MARRVLGAVGCVFLFSLCSISCSGSDSGGGGAGKGGSGAKAGSGGTSGKGGSAGKGGSGTGGSNTGGTGTGGSNTGGTGTGGTGTGGTGTGGSSACPAGAVLSSLGKSKVMVGAAMDDTVATQAPFDLRYQYLSGGIADGAGPCQSCASGCTSAGTSCANSAGCAWWGCWQYDQDPPGAFVRGFVSTAKSNNQIPMITYYMILQAGGSSEGSAEVTKANDAAFMARYYMDWKFVAQQIGNDVALLHIEPDFWGYAQQVNDDPTQIPAAVASADSADCGSLPNTMAGMGQCMITIAKTYAPNAKVSLHGSGWATKFDVLMNGDAGFDVAGNAQKLGQFLVAAGPNADFITVDAADRDAAWYDTQGQNRWWDDTNATLPNFHQAFAWAKGVGDTAQKPILWWQLPLGNMNQTNTTDHWKDNRVDYFMTHMDEVAAADGFGLAFGAGASGQTTPSTDGGNLVSKVNAYASAGGQAPCP